jgi:phosphoglycerate dehydrogenase-like enzyme
VTRVCVLDDWQETARSSADWSALDRRAEVVFVTEPFASEDAAAAFLRDFDVILAMRERTAFPASLVARLPRLALFSVTGQRGRSLDFAAMARQGITICGTGGRGTGAATAELTLALMLAAARRIPEAEAALRAGRFQRGTRPGLELSGKVLGIIGLGKLGRAMAGYGAALGMRVVAWSQNLTPEAAAAGGATYRSKAELIAESDVVSLHLVLSDRSLGIIGAADLARMKPGAILINTSRGPLVDEAALIAALRGGRIVAALDVFDEEPVPPGHPLLDCPNTVLTPHLGYNSIEVFAEFYRQGIENVLAFLDGAPIRVITP